MNRKVKIIKHQDREPLAPEPAPAERTPREHTRDITTVVNHWVTEFKERRRVDEGRWWKQQMKICEANGAE